VVGVQPLALALELVAARARVEVEKPVHEFTVGDRRALGPLEELAQRAALLDELVEQFLLRRGAVFALLVAQPILLLQELARVFGGRFVVRQMLLSRLGCLFHYAFVSSHEVVTSLEAIQNHLFSLTSI